MSTALFVNTTLDELLARAAEFKAKGWRFVQCCATRDDATSEIANLRLVVAANDEVPSVGALFPCAFMFENEMHDLFGIGISGITLDYRGGFYHLHIPTPMARGELRAAKKAAKADGQEA